MHALTTRIEELAANAWSPEVVQHVDGWRLRYNQGETRRANSVLPIADGGRYSLDEKTRVVEGFYAARGLPPRFQVADACAPAELDAYLAGAGYALEAPTVVLTAPLSVVARDVACPPRLSVSVESSLTDEWTRASEEVTQLRGHAAQLRREIMRRTPVPAAYALGRVSDEPVAVGWAAVERGWVGVFGMATRPAFRRQGAARAILHALATHARERGAHDIYLQVTDSAKAAIRLDTSSGLRPAYGYHYRTRFPADGRHS